MPPIRGSSIRCVTLCLLTFVCISMLSAEQADHANSINHLRFSHFTIDDDPDSFQFLGGVDEGYALLRRSTPLIELIDIKRNTVETYTPDPPICSGGYKDVVQLEGPWIAGRALDCEFADFAVFLFNRETSQWFFPATDTPTPEQSETWWPVLNQNRLLWAAMNGCNNGDLYLMDLSNQRVENVTAGQYAGTTLTPALYGEWVAWDQWNNGAATLMLKNLESGEARVIASDVTIPHHPTLTSDWLIWREVGATVAIKAHSLHSGITETLLESDTEIAISQASGRWLAYTESPVDPIPLDQAHQVLHQDPIIAPCFVADNNNGIDDTTVHLYDIESKTTHLVHEDSTVKDIFLLFVDADTGAVVWQELYENENANSAIRTNGAFIFDKHTFLPSAYKE